MSIMTEQDDLIASLQKQLQSQAVQHQQELYWLRLELDTTRREKEAMEDRVAELFRTVQELQPTTRFTNQAYNDATMPSPDIVQHTAAATAGLDEQLARIRISSKNIIQSLKEEMAEIVDDKCRVERKLLNQITDLEHEIKLLHQQSVQPTNDNSNMNGKGLHLAVPTETSDYISIQRENTKLMQQVDKLKGDLILLKSSKENLEKTHHLKMDQEEAMLTLERVAHLWERTDQAIQRLEPLIAELKPLDGQLDVERERLISTLETALLVHGQVKVSLMLIEMKLRNTIGCILNDGGVLAVVDSEEVRKMVSDVYQQAMAAIAQIENVLETQMQQIQQDASVEKERVQDALKSRIEELQVMHHRQTQLEEQIATLKKEQQGEIRKERNANGSEEIYVSRDVMERLQVEILQVIEVVREKNEIIGRLKSTIEQNKSRESALMEALKEQRGDQSPHETPHQVSGDGVLAASEGNDSEEIVDEAIGTQELDQPVLDENIVDNDD